MINLLIATILLMMAAVTIAVLGPALWNCGLDCLIAICDRVIVKELSRIKLTCPHCQPPVER